MKFLKILNSHKSKSPSMNYFRLIFVSLFFLSSVPTFSQLDDGKKPMKNEIEKIMRQKLIDKLSLDEATADKVVNSYRDNNIKLRELNRDKKELMESIELDPSSPDIDSKLDKLLDLDSKILDQRKNFFNELRSYLTPQQIAKTLILRKNFSKELRKQVHKKQREEGERDDREREPGE